MKKKEGAKYLHNHHINASSVRYDISVIEMKNGKRCVEIEQSERRPRSGKWAKTTMYVAMNHNILDVISNALKEIVELHNDGKL